MNTFKRKALFAAVLAGLGAATTGCAGLGATGMTEKQITALAKDDAATGFCTSVVTLGVNVRSVYARVDKGTRQSMRIDEQCAMTFVDTTPPELAK